VIAHEMGHIEHRDVVSRMMKEIGLTVFFSVLLKQNQNVITQVGKSVLSTAFDRNQEALADEFAFKLLSESGIKPTVLATFFQRLMKQNDSSNSKLELIMTHPLDSKRIKAASDYKIPKYFREKKINEQNWKKIKQAI